MRRPAAPNPRTASFLPDLCAGNSALALVLIVEIVAVLVSLARQPVTQNFWLDLAAASMFLLWIGLGSALVLCRATPYLARQSIAKASALALLLIALVIVVVSEFVYQLGDYVSGGAPSSLDVFPDEHFAFVARNVGIGLIVGALALRYFYVRAEWRRSVELEAQARIHALQARIRPHFLFNSMNTIAELTRSDPAKAEQAVEDLADLFRASLSDAKQRITLGDEIDIARVYERMERLRLGDRLSVAWQIDAPLDVMVPSLLLQPLLENAIYHGIERLPDGGQVQVTGKVVASYVQLIVANPVPNPAAGVEPTREVERNGNKLALDNIRKRMQLAWPGKARVVVDQTPGYYSVSLTFPHQR